MSTRPSLFGLRLRDDGRTVRVRAKGDKAQRYVVEDSRRGASTRRREYGSAREAVKDAAKTWRHRLH